MFPLPKIDLGTGRAEYRSGLRKAIDSFGVAAAAGHKPTTEVETPDPKGKEDGGGRADKQATNSLTAAGQEPARLRPAGNRWLKPERDLPMAHAPGEGINLLLGLGRSLGCSRTDKCDRRRDAMREKNWRWAIAAELIRSGVHKSPHTRIEPENVDGAVDRLGDLASGFVANNR